MSKGALGSLALYTLMTCTSTFAQVSTHALTVVSATSSFTLANGKHVKINYCSSPSVRGDRAVLSCAVCVQDPDGKPGECLPDAGMGVVVELVKTHTQGHPATWRQKHIYQGLGISSDSHAMIVENGNTFVEVSKEANENYVFSGMLVLDPEFKVVTERELARVDSGNWIELGGKVIYSTDQRVDEMYPKPNELVVMDLNGVEEKRFPLKGSVLEKIIPLSDSKLAIESQRKSSERNYDNPLLDHPPLGEVVIVDLNTSESVGTLIAGTRTISLSKGLNADSLLALDDRGALVEFNTVTLESKRLLNLKDVVGLSLSGIGSPVVLKDQSIAVLSRQPSDKNGDFFDQHFYLVILKPDGSTVHRKLMTTTPGLVVEPIGLVTTHSGEELIWIGASGHVFVVDASGDLKYALETERMDNLVSPVVDEESGNFMVGYSSGFHILAPSTHPTSLDSLSFQ